MKDDKKVPQLRFPEFTDAWKQRKFGDVLVSIQTGTNKLGSDRNSGQPLLKMGNLQSGYFDLSKLEFLENKAEPENIVKQGDFFFNTRNTLELVGKGATWFGESNKYAFNSNIARFTLKDVNTGFFNYLYNTNYVKKQIRARAMGTTSVAAIYPRSLKSVDIVIPNMEEQIKLSNLFMNLDSTITLQQRKLNSLQKLKKGLLQKMFPKNGENIPEIRFPEFSDAWKQCKLSDLVNVIDGDRGKNYPTEADFEPHGHTLFLNASNVTIDGFLFDTNQFITEEKSNSMGSGKIIKDDIIITSRGSLGHIAWYNDSVQQVMPHLRINSGMLILRNKANVKTSYLHQFMKSDKGKAQIVFMSFGSAQPQLTKKGVESFTVNYPMDTEEQIKIGAFFSKLDNTITLQQRKLESLQKLKKGLLQQMFI